MHQFNDESPDVYWVHKYDWGCTNYNHIWECVQTGLYHFTDEASLIDEQGYATVEECLAALDGYNKELHD